MAMVSMVDYYSVMLDGVAYADFLELFGFDPAVFGKDVFAVGCTQGNRGAKYVSIPTDYFDYQFNTDWMRISAAQMRAIGEGTGIEYANQYKEIATLKANGVRVNFTGSHLKNMRIAGMDPETMALDPFWWTKNCNGGKGICDRFHVTRLDLAYDIVDDDRYPNFPELVAQDLFDFRAAGHDNLPKKKGVSGGGRPLPFRYIYDSDAVCCYLGNSGRGKTHNEYIRIYDKHLERCKAEKVDNSELWSPSTMYRGCKSWTRIELQARDQYATALILKLGTPKEKMEDALHHIYDKFLSTFPYKRAPDFAEWVDLTKFAFCIIANVKELRQQCCMMEKEKSIMDLHARATARAWKAISVEIARVGIDQFFDDINEQLKICSSSPDEMDSAKFDRFRNWLRAVALATDTPIEEMRGLKFVDNHLEFKTYEELKADGLEEKQPADELEQVMIEEFEFD